MAQLDASILTQNRAQGSPLETLAQVQQVFAQGDDARARREAAQQKRDAIIAQARDEKAVNDAFEASKDANGQYDDDKALSLMAGKVTPSTFEKLRTFVDQHKEKEGARVERDLKLRQTKLAYGLDRLKMTTSDTWASDQKDLSSLAPELAPALQGPYDPGKIQRIVEAAQGEAETNKITQSRLDAMKAAGASLPDVAWMGSTAKTKEDYAAVIAKARQTAKYFKVDPSLLDQLPPVDSWTPETAKALRAMALGGKETAAGERADAAALALADSTAKDDARADKAETARERHELEMERQGRATNARLTAQGESGSGNSGLGPDDMARVDAVMNNPKAFENMTLGDKSKIIPELQRRGFLGFGKPLGASELAKVSDSQNGILALKDLRETLKANEQYIGPIAGLQALNPWSAARPIQAKIDAVKQRVGKALEGGVLRKEDEEKYKKILAQLTDTPETAISKVDNMIAMLERDIDTFTRAASAAGRNTGTLGSPPGAATGGNEKVTIDPKTGKLVLGKKGGN